GFADGAETDAIAIGTGLAVTRQPHHDQPRVVGRELLPPEVPLLQHPRAKILDDDVGVARQPAHDRLAFEILEIDGDRLLVARLRVPPERRALVQLAPRAQRIAHARRFDLDHLGAEFGEQARAKRPGDERAELDHFETRERRRAVHDTNQFKRAYRGGATQPRRKPVENPIPSPESGDKGKRASGVYLLGALRARLALRGSV